MTGKVSTEADHAHTVVCALFSDASTIGPYPGHRRSVTRHLDLPEGKRQCQIKNELN